MDDINYTIFGIKPSQSKMLIVPRSLYGNTATELVPANYRGIAILFQPLKNARD